MLFLLIYNNNLSMKEHNENDTVFICQMIHVWSILSQQTVVSLYDNDKTISLWELTVFRDIYSKSYNLTGYQLAAFL